MSTTAAHPAEQPFGASPGLPDAATAASDRTTEPRGVAVRRLALVACPLLAGAFALVGAVNDPAAGLSGTAMTQIYIDSPDPLQWKSTGWHWAYAFWIVPAVLLARTVRHRGVWLANLGAVVGFAGLVTLPGMLIVDWYQSAIGQVYGLSGTRAVDDLMLATMWGPRGFMVAGIVGFVLGLPLAVAGQWRAGRMRWWALPCVLAAPAATFVASGAWWGSAASALFLGVFAVALARAARR